MKTSDFNFDLPQELIAQTPLERRDASRLLVLDKNSGAWEHRHFFDLPEYLHPGDCLILNDSRVLPARLLGQRLPSRFPLPIQPAASTPVPLPVFGKACSDRCGSSTATLPIQ